VPAAPVNDIAGALEAPFTRSTGQIVSYGAPDGTTVTTTGPAIRLPGVAPLTRAAPPLAGDLDAVMAELGIDTAELAALKAEGVC